MRPGKKQRKPLPKETVRLIQDLYKKKETVRLIQELCKKLAQLKRRCYPQYQITIRDMLKYLD